MTTAHVTMDNEGALRELTKLTKKHNIPGAVFGAVEGDATVCVAATGVTNRTTGLEVIEHTLFQAGSIGKAYTATLVMQLVDEGKVDLDAPVRVYLPSLRFADATATETVTTRQLLSHVSGIGGDRLDADGTLFGRGDDSLERYVASLTDLPQIAPPGKLWSYCNSGYNVLGRLVEVLTGETFEAAIKHRLIDPLGLTETVFFAEEAILRSVAVGHMPQPEGDPVVTPIWALGRSGGPAGATINTTIGDLLAFGQMHLRGGLAADGIRVLSEASVRAMQSANAPCPEKELLGDHWGLGWSLCLETGPIIAGHDGNTYGQTAFLRLVPEHNKAFGLMVNLHQANRVLADLCHDFVDEWAGIQTPNRLKPTEGLYLESRRYVGVYASVSAQITISEEKGILYASIAMLADRTDTGGLNQAPRQLKPVDETTVLLPFPEYNDELSTYFLEPDDRGVFEYIHMGARLYRRVLDTTES